MSSRKATLMIFVGLFLWHCCGDSQTGHEEALDYHLDKGISGEDQRSSELGPFLDRFKALLEMPTKGHYNYEYKASLAPPDHDAPSETPSYKDNHDNTRYNNMPFMPSRLSITDTTPSPPSPVQPAFIFESPAPHKKNKNKKAITLSVILTAIVTSLIAALLFLLYRKFFSNGEEQPRSERPLLSLSNLSESLKALYASEAGLNSTNANKLRSLRPQNCTKMSSEPQTLPFSNKPSMHSLDCFSGDESFHSTCETPSVLKEEQPHSWESPSPPSSTSSSSSTSPSRLLPSPFKPLHSPPVSCCINQTKTNPSPPGLSPESQNNCLPLTSKPSPQEPQITVDKKEQQTLEMNSVPARKSSMSCPPLPPCPPLQLSRGGRNSPLKYERKPMGPSNSQCGKEASLPKLKPLYWDKVRTAPDRAMVWSKLRSGSFEFDEEMIESLFSTTKHEVPKCSTPRIVQSQWILEPRRAQNISIQLRALSITKEEVYEALLRGESLTVENLEILAKMTPIKEEEAKLRAYTGEINKLNAAEQFLKQLLDIPFVFKRIQAMLFRATFDDEISYIRTSLETLDLACKELKNSRLFLKLLEAVLKTGNRMNVGTYRGQAEAFKLDALLKLADVKGMDGKTTLLHFVVQEIIRSEGMQSAEKRNKGKDTAFHKRSLEDKENEYRELGLQLVSGLGLELCNVKKVAGIDSEALTASLSKLFGELEIIKQFQQTEVQNIAEEKGEETIKSTCQWTFSQSMVFFLQEADKKIKHAKEEEERVFALVKDVTEYFHGDSAKEEAHPFRIFVIVKDFLGILDNICKEIGRTKRINSNFSSQKSYPLTLTRRMIDGSGNKESSSKN